MIIYSVFLFVLAALFLAVGAAVTTGRYGLVYDYYICNVTDLRAYTRDHGIAMMTVSLPLIACGVLQLLAKQPMWTLIGIGILVVGAIVEFLVFNAIQKKYNGGMF